MRRVVVAVMVGFVLVVSLPGCERGTSAHGRRRPATPKPPVTVNASLPEDCPIYSQSPGPAGDTVVLARCGPLREYSKTVRGNWEWHWSVLACKVLGVEKGRWTDSDLRFVVAQSWPTPESGIMFRLARFPLRPGQVCAFELDTAACPARIVRHTPRSPMPPYGPMEPPLLGQQECQRIANAVDAHLRQHPEIGRWYWDIEGQTPEAYVVMFGPQDPAEYGSPLILLVDRRTFVVRQAQNVDVEPEGQARVGGGAE
jgi:hypothetical protein